MKKILLGIFFLLSFCGAMAQENSKEAKKKATEEQNRALAAETIGLLETKQFIIVPDIYMPEGAVSEQVYDETSFLLWEGENVYLQGPYVAPDSRMLYRMKPSNENLRVDKKGNLTYTFDLTGARHSAKVVITVRRNTTYADVTIRQNTGGNRRFSGPITLKTQTKYLRKANEI